MAKKKVLCQERRIQFEFGPLENLVVKGDKLKLKQLFLNLLDNAVRYTPSGGSISASVVRKGETTVVASRLKDTAPDVYYLMIRMVLGEADANALMMRVDVGEEEIPAVAADWISNNQDVIDQWLGK